MQSELCGQEWCAKVVEAIDFSEVFSEELDSHIDSCLFCANYLIDHFDTTRMAQLKILNLDGSEAEQFWILIEAGENENQIVV